MSTQVKPRVIFVQPAYPHYRETFFRRILFSGDVDLQLYYTASDGVVKEEKNGFATALGQLKSMPFGLFWQRGALNIPFKRGDIFVMTGSPRILSNLLLAIKARLKGARIIWWGHYWSATSKPWRFALRIKIMRLVDSLLFYTDREVDEYKAKFGATDKRPISALNNGIDVEPIQASRDLPFDVEKRPRDLLFIGRITEKSEFGLVIKALAQPSCSAVTLDVIGAGELLQRYKDLAEQLGVADRIVWHGANTDESFIGSVANRCKLFIYPGAVGLSLIHALAYGLPVLVHDDRWKHMPEIAALEPGQNGNVFKLGDVESMADVVARTLHSSMQLEQMSAAAVDSVDKRFNTQVMAQRFLDFVQIIKSNG
jgi:glycosyltransferase involved in cell wall biosynthesis